MVDFLKALHRFCNVYSIIFHSPSAVSANLAVPADLDGVLSLGAPAGVGVLALLHRGRPLAGRRREEVVRQALQAVGGRALPVGDGAGHGRVDAAPRDDGEPQVVALVPCRGGEGGFGSNCIIPNKRRPLLELKLTCSRASLAAVAPPSLDDDALVVDLGGAPDGAGLRVGRRAPVERLAAVLEGEHARLGLRTDRLALG